MTRAERSRASDVLGVELPTVRLIGVANGDAVGEPEELFAPRERIRFDHCAEGVVLLTLAVHMPGLVPVGFKFLVVTSPVPRNLSLRMGSGLWRRVVSVRRATFTSRISPGARLPVRSLGVIKRS